MFTHKDILNRSLFVLNGLENQRLKVSNGRLTLELVDSNKVITRLPFPKILCLLVIGHTTVTTALIEHCNKHGIPIVVMKPNFRLVFFYGIMAEANFLLRKKQFENDKGVLSIAQVLIKNKIQNQFDLLLRTKEKNEKIENAKNSFEKCLKIVDYTQDYRELMGLEGRMSKLFFENYFSFVHWKNRTPRVKQDTINATLDIGYTILFNYIECMTRLFGFDPYMGVYHQLWFRRKSLICDLMEPFRCIIDHQIRKSLKKEVFKESDFEKRQNAYYLKSENRKLYTQTFCEAIILRKNDIYKYTQQYYRSFMGDKDQNQYPIFKYE